MSNLLHTPPEVEEVACDPTPEDWAWHCERTRGAAADPPAAPALPAADWLEGEAAWHRLRAGCDGPLGHHALVAGELLELARSVRFYGAQTVPQFLCYRYRGRDLDGLRVPSAGVRRSPLATLIDRQAARYLRIGSALARLAALALLGLADEVEAYGSATAEDYLADEAAARAAAVDVMCEMVRYF